MRLDQYVHVERLCRRQHRARLVVVQHREHCQHGVRAKGPRLRHLPRVDDEILGQDRSVEYRAHCRQIVQRPTEIGPVGQHADRVRNVSISPRLLRRIDAEADRSLGRRGLLHLHDEARARLGQGRAQASPGWRGRGRTARQSRRHVDPLAGDDLAEHAFRFSHW